eukprot:CAMPEP_0177175414 /NCGR_PEP_ID=MMETSP0367-20130122/12697_1 /TAXON_ID=447022 ORGANISM="Scrippsiella hangoei-like, Strain SHHI-4" /NCGR_SAMPLE_ID=MMETSP0367 /ASSEMBLY_ACC=CAM_ASM_000362 /LENGTH=53 /DNA_ID=CAMNT_0018621833 /DNA_START=1 /DNA_END=159 /DNA_ORIENTATION=-
MGMEDQHVGTAMWTELMSVRQGRASPRAPKREGPGSARHIRPAQACADTDEHA